MREKSSILLFFTSLCGAICICYLDRNLFSISFGHTLRFEYLFWSFFGSGIFFWHRILRLVLAFAAGFLFHTVLHRNKPYLLMTWVFWQIGIYVAYLIWYEKLFWFIENPVNFFWRMLTIVPFLLGATISGRISVLHDKLSSKGIKYAVIGLGVVAFILSAWPFARIMTSAEYRAAREFKIEIHPGAVSVRKWWNPFFGKRTIEFKIMTTDPDSLASYYERKLDWRVMPTFVRDEEQGLQVEPGKEWKWIEVPKEWQIYEKTRGFGLICFVDDSSDVAFSIYVVSERKDPPNLFRVTLISGPNFFKETMKEHQQK